MRFLPRPPSACDPYRPVKSLRLSAAIADFLDHAEIGRNQSLRTVRNYAHYLGRLLAFAGDIPVEELDLDLVRRYRLSLNRLDDGRGGQLLSRKTQNYHIIALRALLKYLLRQEHAVLPPDKIDLAKSEAREVAFLEREELEAIFDSIDTADVRGLRDRALVEMLYSTGLRVSELRGLDRGQVSLERGEFTVRGKGRKTRIVFLSDRCKQWLEQYLAARSDALDPLFVNTRGASRQSSVVTHQQKAKSAKMKELSTTDYRLSTVSIEAIVRKYARLAGLTKKVTPHTLRHTFATQMLMRGADIRSVQELLGHASITTTQVYTHITNTKLREVHRKFHD